MDRITADKLIRWADTYNDPAYFKEDPIAFPTLFAGKAASGKCSVKDVEISAIFAGHFAWGRRAMIVRDCNRLFSVMDWKPYDFVMRDNCPDAPESIHRTIKWCDVAQICRRLRAWYLENESLETLGAEGIRTRIFGQKEDPKAPNKKINMLRRWMIRRDGKVDLGLWRQSDPAELIIPLDTHVYAQATDLGLTSRKQKDLTTAREITAAFEEIFPGDPCKGDFALFGFGVTGGATKVDE